MEVIEEVTQASRGRRECVSVLLRCLAVPDLLSKSSEERRADRQIVDFIKTTEPELWRYFVGDNKLQTFEYIDKLAQAFATVQRQLVTIAATSTQLESILSTKQNTLRSLNQRAVKIALAAYDGDLIAKRIETAFGLLGDIKDLESQSFPQIILSLHDFLSDELAYCEQHKSIITESIYVPFLKSVELAVARLVSASRERFVCDLRPAIGNTEQLAKRYPLNVAEKSFTIFVPMTNTGPGYARAVTFFAIIDTDSVSVNAAEVSYGDIAPGDFAFAIEASVLEPVDCLHIVLEVTWGRAASADRQSRTFDLHVIAQPSNIDWERLKQRDPYSTEVAEGAEFVGRREKLATLLSRLTKDKMESSYITGQKRIGKSSLGRKLEEELNNANIYEYVPKYLEWGEYSNKESLIVLHNLGDLLSDSMGACLPANITMPVLDFTGSLSPLNRLADLLRLHALERRFVFILDEFDELNEDLYRFGPMADTFFSNLRSLAAKPNIAFILIGGEKMPFIMSSQGDQLNKFVQEHLDYFARDQEWSDFVELVTKPTQDALSWNEAALNAIYNATEGHPFYTKLICKRIFANAVQEKDTDVTEREVYRAYDDAVSTLPTNTFAHLWRDGIPGGAEREEAISAQRCRLLVMVTRLIRGKHPITMAALGEIGDASRLTLTDITAYLNEFIRRGYMGVDESEDEYTLRPPLFRDWLRHVGFSLLIADKLSEELEARMLDAEQRAYVTPQEIRELVDSWGTYQGQRISGELVRSWLEQVESFQEQRLLFKLLKNIRFFHEGELRDKLKTIHRSIAQGLPVFVQRIERGGRRAVRKDVIVTYLDGPAKSGAEYAQLYAEENGIYHMALLEMTDFGKRLENYEREQSVSASAIVIVDDILGSGKGIARGIRSFVDNNGASLAKRNIPIIVVIITAHREGIERFHKEIASLTYQNIELRVCEPITTAHAAFDNMPGIWSNRREYDEARNLVTLLGRRVAPKNPLGFENQALLLVFPKTCPNNSLPILHTDSSGTEPWHRLFRRLRN